ncbi:unnamed protein product [Cylicocyclus nassatus]|uniref:Uncharacterized protein n=1 Tax=Cylicocyclus nassatus TaxID=53992 RepID=A0AA36GMU7_CYLNA|nr:unnamed protein product [Cylicocyclus nassatus]
MEWEWKLKGKMQRERHDARGAFPTTSLPREVLHIEMGSNGVHRYGQSRRTGLVNRKHDCHFCIGVHSTMISLIVIVCTSLSRLQKIVDSHCHFYSSQQRCCKFSKVFC